MQLILNPHLMRSSHCPPSYFPDFPLHCFLPRCSLPRYFPPCCCLSHYSLHHCSPPLCPSPSCSPPQGTPPSRPACSPSCVQGASWASVQTPPSKSEGSNSFASQCRRRELLAYHLHPAYQRAHLGRAPACPGSPGCRWRRNGSAEAPWNLLHLPSVRTGERG